MYSAKQEQIDSLKTEIAAFIKTLSAMSENEINHYNQLSPAERKSATGVQVKDNILEMREAKNDLQMALGNLSAIKLIAAMPFEHA